MGLFAELPDAVSVYEVSPRDGLQNESVTVATTRKVRLVEALVEAGLKRIEVSSFVSPKSARSASSSARARRTTSRT
jgi:hydroxymethylglutaryl-CoA lyase